MTDTLENELDPLEGLSDSPAEATSDDSTTETLDSVVDASAQTESVIDEETTSETTGDDAPAVEATKESTEETE